MATTTFPRTSSNQKKGYTHASIIQIILFIFVVFLFSWVTKLETHVVEVVSGHAWQGHATEVNSALDCLDKNGSSKSFKTFGFKDFNGSDIPTNLFLCRGEGDDWYAVVTTAFEKFAWNMRIGRLVTAYKVNRVLYPTIEKFIESIEREWFARAIPYVIEAGEIMIRSVR